uniref:Uncharacterized protein n=1 Tax=Acrobeloides nanus TaxID=290746 RepID=A0A914D5N5_9BILA
IGALKARLIKVEAENKKASKWCDQVVAEKERLAQETPAYIQQYNATLQAYQETKQVLEQYKSQPDANSEIEKQYAEALAHIEKVALDLQKKLEEYKKAAENLMVDTEKAAQALEDTGKEKETILAKLKELKQQEKKLTASTPDAEEVSLSDDEAPQCSGTIKQKVTSSGPINQGGGGGGGQGATTVVVVPACIIS